MSLSVTTILNGWHGSIPLCHNSATGMAQPNTLLVFSKSYHAKPKKVLSETAYQEEFLKVSQFFLTAKIS